MKSYSKSGHHPFQYYKDKNCSDICVGYLDFDPTTEPSERRKFIEYLK